MPNSHPGRLIIVSGPSGAGKSTVLKELLWRDSRLVPSVSATTRKPRPGEIEGRDYHFVSRVEFDRLRAQGEFLECAEVFHGGDWYGTLQSEVAPRLAAGNWVVLEIDVEGARNVLRTYPAAVTIFVQPDSLEELARRLRSRGTETEAAIERRLEVARGEITSANIYRYHVTNKTVEQAVHEIQQILGQPEA